MKLKTYKRGVCRVCGCTDTTPCYTHQHGYCWWIDDRHTLCSHCYYGYYEEGLDKLLNDNKKASGNDCHLLSEGEKTRDSL